MRTKNYFLVMVLAALTIAPHLSFALCADVTKVAAIFEKPGVSEQRMVNVSYSEYRNKYDQLWGQGYRLLELDVNYIYGTPRYSAVWRPSTAGEYQIYGWDYAAFSNYYGNLYGSGWRIHTISSYLDWDKVVKYVVSFRKTSVPEYVLYGWTMDAVVNEYNKVMVNGWRIRTMNAYFDNAGTLRYNVVFEQSSSAEHVIYGWAQQDFINKFNERKNAGWHLEVLETHYYKGNIYYNATFRPGAQTEVYSINNSTHNFLNNNYYYSSSGYSAGWRIDQISVAGPRECNDVILNPVRLEAAEKAETSTDITATSSYPDNALNVFPSHSTSGDFTLTINNTAEVESATIEVYDMMGIKKETGTETVAVIPGEQNIYIKLDDEIPGGYIVKMKLGEAVLTRRIYIVK